MDWINVLENKIEEEKQKINELRLELHKSEAYLKGLEEALKLVPSSQGKRVVTTSSKPTLRSGSVKKTYELIKKTGKPMGIGEILLGIGKPDTKQNRASLASSLYRTARKGGLITKIDENLFSIIDLQSQGKKKDLFNLPHEFGKDDKEEVEPEDIPF